MVTELKPKIGICQIVFEKRGTIAIYIDSENIIFSRIGDMSKKSAAEIDENAHKITMKTIGDLKFAAE